MTVALKGGKESREMSLGNSFKREEDERLGIFTVQSSQCGEEIHAVPGTVTLRISLVISRSRFSDFRFVCKESW